MGRISKQEYRQKCLDHFSEMREHSLSLEQMLSDYFKRYCIFGVNTECKISLIVKETGITKKEIQSLVGTFLKSNHEGFVTPKNKEV